MRIYFVRHGIAEPLQNLGESDEKRKLTPLGLERIGRIAKRLQRISVEVDAIVSSPLARARQTATLLRERLEPGGGVVIDDRLRGDFDAKKLSAILAEHPGAGAIMLVGHEPSFSRVIGEITGGSRIRLKKGGVALVDCAGADLRDAALLWLLPPRVLRKRR